MKALASTRSRSSAAASPAPHRSGVPVIQVSGSLTVTVGGEDRDSTIRATNRTAVGDSVSYPLPEIGEGHHP